MLISDVARVLRSLVNREACALVCRKRAPMNSYCFTVKQFLPGFGSSRLRNTFLKKEEKPFLTSLANVRSPKPSRTLRKTYKRRNMNEELLHDSRRKNEPTTFNELKTSQGRSADQRLLKEDPWNEGCPLGFPRGSN